MKSFFRLFLSLAFLLAVSVMVALASEPVKVYFFYGEGCPHCSKEKQFLLEKKENYQSLEIISFEIHNQENLALFQKIGESLEADVSGVPFTVIGDKYFIGYAEGLTGEEIESQIQECIKNTCADRVASLKDSKTNNQETENTPVTKRDSGKRIKLPLFGLVDAYKFPLPILTLIMGFLDGFNPCAMWTLLFLISLLLGMKNRKRMWILGTAFIIASALVYFLFMSAWFNLIIFLGFVIWVRIIIGILAISGGSYSLKKFLTRRDSGCEIVQDGKRQAVFQKLKSLVGKNSFWIALGGIIGLAFMVNLVELVCSAGLPAVYTQILAINNLSRWQYYLYILLYIFFFMLDDLLVFFAAMITLEVMGISTKYSKYSQLIGGIIMIAIGILLIFKPQWLMFG